MTVLSDAPRPPGRAAPPTPERASVVGPRTDIQGLRAVAVLLVVGFHAGVPWLTGGFVGVDIFFVISGFVITLTLTRQLEAREGRLDLGAFVARRVRRLLPALAVTTTVVCLASMALLSPLGPQQLTAKTAIAASSFVANIALYRAPDGYFATPAHANALLHTWSLSVEEQYYLLYPSALMLAWLLAIRHRREGSTRGHARSMVLAGTVISFVACVVATRHNPTLAFYATPLRAWEFLAGALVALSAVAVRRMAAVAATPIGLLGAVLLVYSVRSLTPRTPFPGTAALWPVLGAVLLIIAGGRGSGVVHRLLSSPSLTWIGDRSYGWYLWHWPFIVFAETLWHPEDPWVLVGVAIIALVPASLSYQWLEEPIRRATDLRGRRLVRLAGACILIPILAGVALWTMPTVIDVAGGTNVRQEFRLHADVTRGCDAKQPLGERDLRPCTWTVPEPRGRVLLVGDSNAGQFTEAVAAAANSEGYDFTAAVQSGCPLVDVHIALRGDSKGACEHFVEATIPAIVALHPSMVVLAAASDRYVNEGRYVLTSRDGTEVGDHSREKMVLWQHGLSAVLDRLQAVGIPTLIVHAVPHFPGWDPTFCPAVELYAGPPHCGETLSRREIESVQRRSYVADDRALIGHPHAAALDLSEVLCSGDTCATWDGDEWLYRDGFHLSVAGARRATNRFASVIAAFATPVPPSSA